MPSPDLINDFKSEPYAAKQNTIVVVIQSFLLLFRSLY